MFYVAKHLDATVGNAHQLSWAYAGFQEVIQELGCPNCNASWGASCFCYVLKAVPCKKCPSDPRYLEKQISKASDKIYLNSQNYSNVNNCRPKENNVGFLYIEKQHGILYEGIFSRILFQYPVSESHTTYWLCYLISFCVNPFLSHQGTNRILESRPCWEFRSCDSITL